MYSHCFVSLRGNGTSYPIGPDHVSPVPARMSTSFSRSWATSRKTSGSSSCETRPICHGPPSAWSVTWRIPSSLRSNVAVSNLCSYSLSFDIGSSVAHSRARQVRESCLSYADISAAPATAGGGSDERDRTGPHRVVAAPQAGHATRRLSRLLREPPPASDGCRGAREARVLLVPAEPPAPGSRGERAPHRALRRVDGVLPRDAREVARAEALAARPALARGRVELPRRRATQVH